MARLRRTNVINVFTLEEKTRVTNLFMLLVEIDVRLLKSAKTKAKKRVTTKTKHRPSFRQGYGRQAIKKEPFDIIYASNKTSRPRSSIRTARRDVYLQPFAHIFF